MNAVSLLHKICYSLCNFLFLKDIVGKGMGVRAKESSASSQACSASEEETARNLGFMLRDIAGRYEKQLSDEFDTSTSSPWDVNYSVFRTICSNVLRRTISSVTNRWDQTLLVFAGYMRLREALHDSERQNEISSYVGRYLSDMGFQSWIQLQGGWVSLYDHNSHFCIHKFIISNM